MPQGSSRASSALAAAVLALITLSVFFVRQSGGPESVVHRFHEAAAQRSGQGVQSVILEDLRTSPTASQLAEAVSGYLGSGGTYQVVSVEPLTKGAIVHVVYLAGGRSTGSISWYVQRHGSRWLINTYDTVTQPKRSLGMDEDAR